MLFTSIASKKYNTKEKIINTMPIMIGILWWAFVNYRTLLGGYVSYGKLVGYGVMISLVAAILNSIFAYVLYDIIDPSLIEAIKAMSETQMLEQGMQAEQVDQAMEISGKFITPAFISIMAIPTLTFMGLIFSLIIAIFVKKNEEFPA